MREIFTEIFENQPLDPTEAARQAVRPRLRKRFYKQAQLTEVHDGVGISLDGSPVLTPRRRAFVAPTPALAAAIAAEWDAQGEHIDPRHMPLTRLANAVIDAVSENRTIPAKELKRPGWVAPLMVRGVPTLSQPSAIRSHRQPL
jgi:chaperone required for assembly of F1-ATPase